MAEPPERITKPLLDVLKTLRESDVPLHGWEIKKRTHRSGPTVYNNLDRIESAGWVTSRRMSDGVGPVLKKYVLNDQGRAAADELLHPSTKRKPGSLAAALRLHLPGRGP